MSALSAHQAPEALQRRRRRRQDRSPSTGRSPVQCMRKCWPVPHSFVRGFTIGGTNLLFRDAKRETRFHMLPKCRADVWTRLQADIQAAPTPGNGTVLVIGANTGPGPTARGSDPMFAWLATSQADSLDKVFVEPMPHIFPVLKHNIQQIPRARAVAAAIANTDGHLPMFCLGVSTANISTAEEVHLSEEAQRARVPEWVVGTCSLSRDRFFSERDFCARNRHSVHSATVACRRPGLATEAKHSAFEA